MVMTSIVDDQVGKQCYADWKQQWDLQHPEPDEYSTRRFRINDLLDYLTTNQGCLSEIRVYMRRGSLSVIAESEDCRGSSWYIENGILPTECESILNILSSEYDGEVVDMVNEEWIGATLATVLHLRGVKNPIELADHMREEYCLASWLKNVSIHPARAGRDVWDTFAEVVQSDWDAFVRQVQLDRDSRARQAEFDAMFPPEGPSGETVAKLKDDGWTPTEITECAKSHGYRYGQGAIRSKEYRYRKKLDIKKRKANAKQAFMQLSDASETPADRIANIKRRFMQAGDASDKLVDRIVDYLRNRMNESGVTKSAGADVIASFLGEDAEKVLKILEANPDKFIKDRDGRWTLKNPT